MQPHRLRDHRRQCRECQRWTHQRAHHCPRARHHRLRAHRQCHRRRRRRGRHRWTLLRTRHPPHSRRRQRRTQHDDLCLRHYSHRRHQAWQPPPCRIVRQHQVVATALPMPSAAHNGSRSRARRHGGRPRQRRAHAEHCFPRLPPPRSRLCARPRCWCPLRRSTRARRPPRRPQVQPASHAGTRRACCKSAAWASPEAGRASPLA
mmetsp:Transcript_2336/g.6066  ORF Transcript_2336/g.6066 Transcript_2336/m.6066 type:complete len:205 (-) Transcript_2336:538-1152(-)